MENPRLFFCFEQHICLFNMSMDPLGLLLGQQPSPQLPSVDISGYGKRKFETFFIYLHAGKNMESFSSRILIRSSHVVYDYDHS